MTAVLTATLPLVAPVGPCVSVRLPYDFVGPYSKYQVVGSLLGLTVPLSVAEVAVISCGALVAAAGRDADAVAGPANATTAKPTQIRARWRLPLATAPDVSAAATIGEMRTLVWRGLDEPRMEVAHVESWDRAQGTQIGVGYELRWQLDGTRVHAELVGESERAFELGETDFFDIQHSPFFNSLPVVRDGLLAGGEPRVYVMTFVSFPPLDARQSKQLYMPLGQRRVRYSSGDFVADIEFGADGFVELYEDYIERIE